MATLPNKTFAQATNKRNIEVADATIINEARVALVIGNGAYENITALPNPVNDADDMTAALTRLGFTVQHIKDANYDTMDDAINNFGTHLKTNRGVGLFYYAGHGVQRQGKNYLVPVDIKIDPNPTIVDKLINVSLVLDEMKFAENRLNMVILDACRDNPFPSLSRSMTQGLAQIDAPSGTLLAYATAPGSVASDGSGRNGTYTKYLLSNLERPRLKIEDLFKAIRVGVMNETNKTQIPWENTSLVGDFYFVKQQLGESNAIPATTPQQLPHQDLCRQPDINGQPIECLFRGL